MAVERIFIHQRLQARHGRGIGLAHVIEASDFEFALGEDFLHFEQPLLAFGDHFLVVGILQDQVAILIFRALGVGVVAVRFFHLLVLDVGDLELRLGRFRHVGEEGFKVAVFLLGLGQRGGATLGVPGVTDRQFGAGDELGVGIGVDQRL